MAGGNRAAARRAARAREATREQAPARPRFEAADHPAVRALAAHPNLTAAALLALPVLVCLWRALLGLGILSPGSVLYLLAPWAHLRGPSTPPYFNLDLYDVPTAIYPWRVFAREAIHSGTFPAWNPHVFAGSPFYANPANGLFSIFSLPLWILPLNYGIGVGAALKLWAAGFGTWLLARELRLGMLPALLAGVGFAFSALNIVWLTHESLPAVAVVMPWMVWIVERILSRGRLVDVGLLALATAIALGGGHAGMQVHVMVIVGLYALLRAALLTETSAVQRLRLFALALAGLGMGALLMAFMLLPELLSSRDTLGTAARHGGRGSLPGTNLPLDALKTTLFPDWWGRPTGIEARGIPPSSAGGAANYNERTFYAGVVTLLLASVALLARGDWRRKAPFLTIAVIGLAVPVHAPVLYWLSTHLPVLADVQSQRLHFAYAFAAAMLAAFGLKALLDRPTEARWLAVPAVAAFVALLALTGAGAKGADAAHTLRHFLTGADFQSRGVLALTSVGWFALFAAGVGAALLAARRWPAYVAAIAAGVVLLGAIDMVHFAYGYQPIGPASKILPARTPGIAFLQRHADEGRVTGVEFSLGHEWMIRYGLDDVRGYEPPQPTLRFFHLWQIGSPDQLDWRPFTFESVRQQTVQVVSVLGARYIFGPPRAGISKEAEPLVRALRPVYRGRDATVFLNEHAAPRALVPQTVLTTGGERETLIRIFERRFDARHVAVVESGRPDVAALADGPAAQGRVRIAGEENASVTLRATLARRGLVVLNDNLVRGWSVRVDGRDAPALRVNDVMRGVVVGPGEHEIVWSYAVPGLRAGLALSLLTLALLVALAVWDRRRAPRGD